MTYKQIEASRNVRLWVVQIGMPLITMGGTILASSPKAREAIASKAKDIKDSIKNTINKKESKSNKRIIVSINAVNREEALKALEKLAKDIIESPESDKPIKRSVQTKTH